MTNLFSFLLKKRRNSKTNGTGQPKTSPRLLRLETLEERQLLSVSRGEYEAIRAEFSDYDLSADISETNLIEAVEVTAANFQDVLRETIGEAGETVSDDLIVLRLAETENFTVSNTWTIDVKEAEKGGIAVVGVDSDGEFITLDTLIGWDALSVAGGTFLNGIYYYNVPDDQDEDAGGETAGDSLETAAIVQYKTNAELIGLDSYLADERFASIDGSGYATAIIDTGILATHQEFTDRIVCQYNFTGETDEPIESAEDLNGHGSHVAGIAAGSTFGVARGADIVALKVFKDGSGQTSGFYVRRALKWVVANAETYNIKSVNLSLGAQDSAYTERIHSYYSSELTSLSQMGVIVCISAGNSYNYLNQNKENPYGVGSPACDINAISVGATWTAAKRFFNDGVTGQSRLGGLAYFSQRDPLIMDIAAPGTSVLSAGIFSDDCETRKTGTSMSAPVVTGAAVLAQAVANEYLGRSLTVEEFRLILRNSAVQDYDAEDDDVTVKNMEAYYYSLDVYAMAEMIYEMGTNAASPDVSVILPIDWNDSVIISTDSEAALSGQEFWDREEIYVKFEVGNLGAANVRTAFNVSVRLENDGTVLTKEFKIFSLDSFQSFANQFNFGVLKSGDWTLTITVDSGNLLGDYNRANNVLTRNFTVKNYQLSALTVTTIADTVADDGETSLREALAAAEDGDVIMFSSRFKGGEKITLSSELGSLLIQHSVTIDASKLKKGRLAISAGGDASNPFRVFWIASESGAALDVTFNHLILTGGIASDKGGAVVFGKGSLTFKDCQVYNNSVAAEEGDACGGAVYGEGTLILNGSTLSGNRATSVSGNAYGGGAFAKALQMTDSTIKGSAAVSETASAYGGGFYSDNAGAELTLTDSALTANTAQGESGSAGGGIYSLGSLTLVASTVSRNTAAGSDSSSGGGIYNVNKLILRNSSVFNNSAVGMGGGIYNAGTLEGIDSKIYLNNGTGDLSSGGGLYNLGDAVFSRSSIYKNTSILNGGGIANLGTLSMTNALLTENESANGGGIWNQNGVLTLRSVTAAKNRASVSGGGIFYAGTSETLAESNLYNTILAVNEASNAGADFYNGGAFGGVNAWNLLAGETEWTGAGKGEGVYFVYDADSSLFADAENGDWMLAPASQAIDQGSDAWRTTDLDYAGRLRVAGERIDLGAYEYIETEAFSTLVTTAEDIVDSADGKISLREAIANAADGSVITFSSEVFSTGNRITLDPSLGELCVTVSLTIDASAFPEKMILAAGNACRLFRIENVSREISVEFINLTLTGGDATQGAAGDQNGGAILNLGANLTLTHCKIAQNNAERGGGVYNTGHLTLTETLVTGNQGTAGGGIANASGAWTVLSRSQILANSVSEDGGGIYNWGTLTLDNSLIANNFADRYGGGIANAWADGVSGSVEGSGITIAKNYALNGGGLANLGTGTVTLYNSIVVENMAAESDSDIQNASGGIVGGDRVLSAFTAWDKAEDAVFYIYNASRPLFRDASGGDFSLASGSQALDGGRNDYAVGSADCAGQRRIGGRAVDLGAYELLIAETASSIVTTAEDVVDSYDGLISLREAINYAKAGSVITFDSSFESAHQTIRLNSEFGALVIDHSLTIDASACCEGVTMDAQGASRVLELAAVGAPPTVVLKSLTITGGFSAEKGGGIYLRSGILKMTNCSVTGNRVVSTENAASGGGIFNDGGQMTLTRSSVIGNAVESNSGAVSGGGIAMTGVLTFLTLDSSQISGNRVFSVSGAASGGGIAILNSSNSVMAENSQISENNASSEQDKARGGGIYNYSGILDLTQTILRGNILSSGTGSYGGGLANLGSNGSVTLTNVQILDNSARYESGEEGIGGGIYSTMDSGIFDGTNLLVAKNEASCGGGMAILRGNFTLTNGTITANRALQGGGLAVDGGNSASDSVNIVNSILVGNEASDSPNLWISNQASFAAVNAYSTLSDAALWTNAGEDGVFQYLYDSSLPLFMDAANGDYRLAMGSQGIDRGDSSRVWMKTDLWLQTRVIGSAVDLGAFETQWISLSAPNGLTAFSATENLLFVYWETVASASGYALSWSFDQTVWQSAETTATNYTLTNPSPGTVYYFKVRALGDGAASFDSADSAVISVTTQGTPAAKLTAPANLTAVGFGGNRVKAEWDAAVNAAGYRLEYSIAGAAWQSVTVSETACIVEGLPCGAAISWRVTALAAEASGVQDSDASAAITSIVCPVDVNSDGKINLADYALVSAAFRSAAGDAAWDPRCDINGDGKVNLADYAYLSQNFMKKVSDSDIQYPDFTSASSLSEISSVASVVFDEESRFDENVSESLPLSKAPLAFSLPTEEEIWGENSLTEDSLENFWR